MPNTVSGSIAATLARLARVRWWIVANAFLVVSRDRVLDIRARHSLIPFQVEFLQASSCNLTSVSGTFLWRLEATGVAWESPR